MMQNHRDLGTIAQVLGVHEWYNGNIEFWWNVGCNRNSKFPWNVVKKLKILIKTISHLSQRFILKTIFISGDHGGDSQEELSAALYMYSKKNTFKGFSETTSVNQVRTYSALKSWPFSHYFHLGKKTVTN